MPRWLEFLFASLGIILLSPILSTTAILVWLLDGRPVLFVHTRIGRGGHPFGLYKFRSMRASPNGPAVTATGDARITRLGRILRKSKIDELPQLFNVFLGDMSFVGPRPEVKEFVDLYTPEQRRVLNFRPGITDPASIAFHDESDILANVEDWRKFYIKEILPKKLKMSLNYLENRSFRSDMQMIFSTITFLIKNRLFRKH